MSYSPKNGFYDLREFDIPKTEFKKLCRIQSYLYKCEEQRKKGLFKEDVNKLNKIKQLSAEYQHCLFSYNIKLPKN